jgi:uncharacterized membrane protein YdjX (TVP38/TMEM64 family)
MWQQLRRRVGLNSGQVVTKSRSNWLRVVLLAALVLGVMVAIRLLPLGAWSQAALDWVRGLGGWAYVAFIALYVLATVLFLPGSILTLGAGALFGVVTGTLLVSVSSTLGALAAFSLGRGVARDWVQSRISGNARFAALDAAVARDGWKIVLLTRLSPAFPFNLLNYAFGLTGVASRDYALASWLGMLPGTILYVYAGSLLGSVAEIPSGPRGGERTPGEWVLAGIGLAATVAVSVYVARLARRALSQRLAPPAAGT